MKQEARFQNPNEMISDVMATIGLLRDVYERETEALNRADMRAFVCLQPEKMERADAYRDGVEMILRRRHEMREADAGLKKKLQVMQEDFAALANDNMNALERMKRCSVRLSQRIETTAREHARQHGMVSYGQTGALHHGDSKRPLSLGLQETV